MCRLLISVVDRSALSEWSSYTLIVEHPTANKSMKSMTNADTYTLVYDTCLQTPRNHGPGGLLEDFVLIIETCVTELVLPVVQLSLSEVHPSTGVS